MRFELKSKNLNEFKDLLSKILFNPAIRSAGFDDDFKVIINLDRSHLADFSMLIRNTKVEVAELRVWTRRVLKNAISKPSEHFSVHFRTLFKSLIAFSPEISIFSWFIVVFNTEKGSVSGFNTLNTRWIILKYLIIRYLQSLARAWHNLGWD